MLILFSSKENMEVIHENSGKHFIMALKSNRNIALSEEDKKQGNFIRIDELLWLENNLVRGWIKGIDFPILLHPQVFTNKDDSTGIVYLACSDLTLDKVTLETIYQKRWKVKVFHKILKSNTALAKSPTKCIRTQSNRIFISIYSPFQLEFLKLKHKVNHFLGGRLYIKALRTAINELNLLKNA